MIKENHALVSNEIVDWIVLPGFGTKSIGIQPHHGTVLFHGWMMPQPQPPKLGLPVIGNTFGTVGKPRDVLH